MATRGSAETTLAPAAAGKSSRDAMGDKTLKFKSDKFRKSRGGYSRWLLISCEKCKKQLFVCQKDGPGILKRLYSARILGRNGNSSDLVCKKCNTALGVPIMHQKERRRAYRLFAGAVEKETIMWNKAKKFPFDRK